jgi:hypothetical protein
MLRVPPEVTVEPVSHVQELFSDHQLERPRPRLIDAWQVDQNEMIARRGRKLISAADRAPYPAAQPALEDASAGRDAETFRWQPEERDVSFQKFACFLMVDQPSHSDLPGDGSILGRIDLGAW